ncbi:Leukotoxin [archaeon HR04]|nr:Leukotoxin [archaeon HR04]
MADKSITSVSVATSTLLLLIAISMTVADGVRMAYAQVSSGDSGECVGHTIERGNFDDDGDDEVRVDGTVYNNGYSIILDGKIYTVRIATPSSSSTPFIGTAGNDFIVGTNSADSIYGKEGDDFIVGLGGNDELYGDVIFGGAGDDEITGGNDILCGNDGNDVLVGDSIRGGAGNDTITGGNDTLDGGAGNDALSGDDILGWLGDDILTGGNDKLVGGAGDDILYGDGIYEDDIDSEGDDTLTGGNDTLDGGAGNDALSGDDILGWLGDDILTGGNDKLVGGAGDDILYGDGIYEDDIDSEGDDTLTGGNDTLDGGAGNDTLHGDHIDREGDPDTLTGGNDVINAVDSSNNDNIDGDGIFGSPTSSITLGNQDICASDPDPEVNCEYDDISSLATLSVAPTTIPIGGQVTITFNSNVNNNVKITNLTVTTPLGNTCTYNALPIIVPAYGLFKATYPDDFTGTGCDTSTVGTYTVEAETEVGDPIVTKFNTSFQVVPEAIAGALGIVGAGFISMLLYRRGKKQN